MDRTKLTARGERVVMLAQGLALAIAFWAGLVMLFSILGTVTGRGH